MFCSPDSPLGFRLPLSATKGRCRRCAHMAGKSHSRLKVYATHIGLHEWLVAAPSQKAALKAWDVRENLFATGAAKVVTDPKAVKLAMTAPGDPVARDENGAAARANQAIRAAGPRVSKSVARSRAGPPKPAKPKIKPTDRAKLERAEKALEEFHGRLKRERALIEKKRRSLDLEAEGLEADFEAEKERLEKTLDRAQKAVESARG